MHAHHLSSRPSQCFSPHSVTQSAGFLPRSPPLRCVLSSLLCMPPLSSALTMLFLPISWSPSLDLPPRDVCSPPIVMPWKMYQIDIDSQKIESRSLCNQIFVVNTISNPSINSDSSEVLSVHAVTDCRFCFYERATGEQFRNATDFIFCFCDSYTGKQFSLDLQFLLLLKLIN
jgi:hypothetical protein